jgi:hypothetical protein
MAQESKRLLVKRLGGPGTVAVDLLPWDTAGDVLRKSGADPEMLLSTCPHRWHVYEPGEEIFAAVVSGQLLFALHPGGQGC